MIKISHLVAALLFASISVAHAETPNQPVSQGAASVDKNLARDPDNKGLQRASEQLEENQQKIAAKRRLQEEKRQHREEENRVRRENRDHDRMERREKMERPAKIERPGR
jgi:TolA-binding protein